MKSRELLSIVLSLVMVLGVTAGSAYAQTDEVDIDDSAEIETFDDDTMKDDERDDYKMKNDKDMKDKLARYCEMSDEDKRAFLAEHDKAADHAEKMNEYCELDEDARDAYIKDHKDDYKMKEMDKGKHMDYDRLCALSESDRALEFDDSEKLERISNWCDMSPEEREDFKKENHDNMKEKRQEALDRIQENPNIPQRIKEMIMEKRDIVDDRLDEIRMKYEEKHGDFDEKKSELKMKFKNHMATMQIEISEERKSAIQDRVAEMKAFKMELRERSSELSDEEKQELRAEFIEKAKDIRLAWISPHQQMNAGIDAAEIECREGFSLVLKESNGRAMCLKADTALKMIERGIAVPAI